jgi:ferritin-like protein
VTRREALVTALAASLAAPTIARGQDRDGDIVKDLIAREEGAAYAYRGLTLPGVADLADQDTAHVKALRTQLQALGRGTAPISAEDLDAVTRRVAEAPADQRIAAAIALETELLDRYRDAVIGLVEPGILQTVATILACHAQNRALLARTAS